MTTDRITRVTAGTLAAVKDRIILVTAATSGSGAKDRIVSVIASTTLAPGDPGYTVSAGTDQTVEPFTSVTLTATSSGTPESWAWDQISGPDVPLTGADTNAATFLADAYPDTTVLVFRAFGIDDGKNPAVDDVTVTVYPHTMWASDGAGGLIPLVLSV